MKMPRKIWDLKYELGNTGRVVTCSSGPYLRSKAIATAKEMSDRQSKDGEKPWLIWVESRITGEVIWNNEQERMEDFLQDSAANEALSSL